MSDRVSQGALPTQVPTRIKRTDEGNRRARLSDVARLAGVHASTASRALNGSSSVNAQLRQRVEEAARSLNYEADDTAKQLRQRSRRAVLLVICAGHGAAPDVVMVLFSALCEALAARGADLLLSTLAVGGQAAVLRDHRARRFAAVLMLGHDAALRAALDSVEAPVLQLTPSGACVFSCRTSSGQTASASLIRTSSLKAGDVPMLVADMIMLLS